MSVQISKTFGSLFELRAIIYKTNLEPHERQDKNPIKMLSSRKSGRIICFSQFPDQTRQTASRLLARLIHITMKVRERSACKRQHGFPPFLSSPVRRRALSMHAKARLPLLETTPSRREVHLVSLPTPHRKSSLRDCSLL